MGANELQAAASQICVSESCTYESNHAVSMRHLKQASEEEQAYTVRLVQKKNQKKKNQQAEENHHMAN